MLAFFLIVMGVPLMLAAIAFVFFRGITWKEFACTGAACLVVAGSSAAIVSCANTHDTEIWNGRVASKNWEHVSCSHSYQCNCHEDCSGSGNNRSCSQVCSTCYEHLYDVDWEVHTTNGEEIDIDRVDRQGVVEPPRWTSVKVGEPTSVKHSYTNYIKAAPGTLFRHQGLTEKYQPLPDNPQRVTDYYRLNHFVVSGWPGPAGDWPSWINGLSELNADISSSKQANVIVVMAYNKPSDWYYALEESWLGGKKNDVVLVVSVDSDLKPQWARVMCWTTNELFKVKLRDDIMALDALTAASALPVIKQDVTRHFVRKPMKDFEYLKSEITPTLAEWIVTLVISLLISVGLLVFFGTQDPFDSERSEYSWKRSYHGPHNGSKRWQTVREPNMSFLPWYRRWRR